ncbi:MAG: hypothetical protein ACYCST_07895 [Acidimicrobiales bacterium]
MLRDDHQVVGHVVLTFRIWHQDGSWQGCCKELGVPSFGDSPDGALGNVLEATITYLNEIEAIGERERIFTEHHLSLRSGTPEEKSRSQNLAPNESVTLLELGLAVGG